MRISHIAGSKDARHIRARRARFGDDIARFVRLDPLLEDVRIRLVANGQEEAIDGNVHLLLIRFALTLHKMRTFHAAFAKQSEGVVLKQHSDIWCIQYTVLHHLRGTQIGLADNQVNVRREASQVERFLTRRVATADHGHLLLAIEETVAGGARRNAHSGIFLFVGQTQILSRGARSDDQCFSLDDLLTVDGDLVRSRREVGRRGNARTDIGAETFGLTSHVSHHFCARDAVGIAREVLYFRRRCQLSTRLKAFVQHRLQVGS